MSLLKLSAKNCMLAYEPFEMTWTFVLLRVSRSSFTLSSEHSTQSPEQYDSDLTSDTLLKV